MDSGYLETNTRIIKASQKLASDPVAFNKNAVKTDSSVFEKKFVDSEAAEALSVDNIVKAIETTNVALQGANNSLRFQLDKSVKQPIVSVVDENSGKIIRQFPSEEMVRVSRNIDSLRGVIFDKRS